MENQRNLSILLVDDDEAQRILMKRYLGRGLPGYKIDGAKSGEELIELAQKQKYNLIVTDHNMPGMTGYEAVKELREDSLFLNSNTPVIIHSFKPLEILLEEQHISITHNMCGKYYELINLPSTLLVEKKLSDYGECVVSLAKKLL